MASELLPLAGEDVAQEEGRAAGEALGSLRQAAKAAAEHLERMQGLVQALQASSGACTKVLEGEERAAQSAAACAAAAQALHGARLRRRDDVRLALDQETPAEGRCSAILNQAQVNVGEASDREASARESLEHAQEGWRELQKAMDGGLREREAAHAQRLRSGELAGLEEDDLRTLLAGRGLGAVFDRIKASLPAKAFDGALLAGVMRGRKPFAEKLEEVLEATMGVDDVCSRIRAVHVIELATLGMDVDRYSEGGSEGTCCCWSEERVRQELRGRGVDVADTQLAGVNGEVLLLLRAMHLEQLGADSAGLKLSLMEAANYFSEEDLVGRIRLGLEEPPVPELEAVGAREAEEVRRSLERALSDDGEPCLVPMGLVSAWTDNFAESRRVGEGAFGEVYEGVVAPSVEGGKGRVVAVKRLSADSLLKGGERHMQREINVLHQFKHPNIIRLLGYTAASAGGCLVYEMGSRGSLAHNLLDKALAEALTWKLRVRVAHGLSRALNYLHCNSSAPALHRDVKSANVVLCADFTPKLIDCGLARYAGEGPHPAGTVATTTQGVALGTPGYMCPRYQRGGVEYDAKCEVFSLGVVLLELVTGKVQGCGEASDLYSRYVDEEEEEIAPDPRAGAWPKACLEELTSLALECLAKYGKRIASMMAVLRRVRGLEDAHCRQTEEEARQARELVRLQGEKDAGRADGVFAEKLRRQLLLHETELSRLRGEQLRLAAERAEEAKRAEQEMRECCVCFDRLRCAEGISCKGSTADGHFHCDGCFSAEVTEQCAPENFGAFKLAGMRLRCRACLPNKAFFDDASVPAHLDGASFSAYLRARENVQVGEAMQEQDHRHAKQMQELQAQLEAALQQANGHKSAAVLRHRMHIVENILTLKCPRDACRAAFIDFDGCFALTCSRCGCGFCAYCLADCGGDAHAHVANCEHNTAPGRSLHSTVGAFQQAQKARITRLLREYVAREVEADFRTDLVGAMDRDLQDLGIAGSDVLA